MKETELSVSGLLEGDRETLLGALRRAGTPDRAERTVEQELDLLLLRYNEGRATIGQRTAAASMLETLRAALGLLSSQGEPKIWTLEAPGRRPRLTPVRVLLPLAGLLFHAAAFCMMWQGQGGAVLPALLLLAGMGTDIAAGVSFAAAGRKPEPERRAETVTDWERVYGALHTAALVVDRNLAELAGETPQTAPGEETPDGAALELLGALLEALYSGDGAFALERLQGVRSYLRDRGIETVEYSEAAAEQFDRLPGLAPATLRPALVREGRLLLRGLAVGG